MGSSPIFRSNKTMDGGWMDATEAAVRITEAVIGRVTPAFLIGEKARRTGDPGAVDVGERYGELFGAIYKGVVDAREYRGE